MTVFRVVVVVVVVGDVPELYSVHGGKSVARRRLGEGRGGSAAAHGGAVELAATPDRVIIVLDVLQAAQVQLVLLLVLVVVVVVVMLWST